MTAESLSEQLRARARALGFRHVGIAPAEVEANQARALEAWLRRDYQASMIWMRRTEALRRDPAALLPGCRSVVSVAVRYAGGHRETPRPARVARYARGRDYHRVMGRPLRALAAWLEERTGALSRAFVDTGPVLERAFAQKAGLGWIGKNANLIHLRAGSYLLLGEVLTVAELAPDPPMETDHCGRCTACLDACPTSAFPEPGVVDARRCIAYWTIEHRGAVPEDVRPQLGDHLFGCDVCQEVCPWNRHELGEADPLWEARAEIGALDPREILELDEPAFRARFQGTPLMRARWDGMRRNACIVLGNTGEAEDARWLEPLMEDPDPMIREHAAWALTRLGQRRTAGTPRPRGDGKA